jgi:hypothetical protein
VLLREDLHPGRQPARRGAAEDGLEAFWAALRGYIAANRDKISTTQTLLQALDAATPINLGSTLFAPRFPSIY